MRITALTALALMASAALFSPAARAQGDKPAAPGQPVKAPAPTKIEQPPANPKPAPAPKTDVPAKAPADKPATENSVYVIIKTSSGNITLELNGDKAPKSTKNFLAYVDKGFYNGLIFHRVIPKFMIQGGGFTADMTEKRGETTVQNEWQNGLKNTRGTVAMARLGGQADSASSQFFINTKDNSFLDSPRDGAGYAVFGKVVDGMDIVDKIEMVKTTTKKNMPDVPVDAVVMSEVRRATPEEVTAIKAKLGKK